MDLVRRVEVAPERIERWLDGFAQRHGGARVEGTLDAGDEPVLVSVGGDGARATVHGFRYDPLAFILVRRGGYGVALALAGELAAHKVGRRHVQSRTAAGGWSQQRFARRRVNQADELVRAVTEHAVRLLSPGSPRGLVVGGDRALVAAVLADPRLGGLSALPRRELYDLADPSARVLRTAVDRGRALRVDLEEPPAP